MIIISNLMMRLSIISVHVIILFVCLPEIRAETSFEITLSGRQKNTITLGCLQRGAQVEDAVYFNNGTQVEIISKNEGQLIFVISRDLEGVYTCGNESGPMSNGLRLIAYPDLDPIRREPPIFAAEGTTVTIDCGISPGRLIQQYFITWYKFNGGTAIIEQTMPDRSLRQANDQYDLDPSTLSLIIYNVHKEDASHEYYCELTVVDPEIGTTYSYRNLETNFITLVVLGSFQLQVDVTQEGDVLFEVNLPTPLSAPVKLLMQYTANHATVPVTRTQYNLTTNAAFLDASSFLYREYASRVPFDQFQVGVRLVSASRDKVLGPLVEDPGYHAKNAPTLINATILGSLKTEDNTKYYIITGGGVGGGVILIAVMLAAAVMCYKFHSVHQERIKELEIEERMVKNPHDLMDKVLDRIRNSKDLSDDVIIEMLRAVVGVSCQIPVILNMKPTNITENTIAASEKPEGGTTSAPDAPGESGTTAKSHIEYDCEATVAHVNRGPPPPYVQSINDPVVKEEESISPQVREAVETLMRNFMVATRDSIGKEKAIALMD